MTRYAKLALLLVAIAAIAGVYAGCQTSEMALAAGCPTDNPASTTVQLNACLSGLDFDPMPGAGDEQRLMINPPCPPGSCRHGPLATIQPEKKSHQNTDADLQQGRYIAKLFLNPGQAQGYPKLGLSPGGVTYWWVKQTSATGGRSVYIAHDTVENTLTVAVDTTFQIDLHPGYEFKQGLARWAWSDNDETAWSTCKKDACCR